MNSQNEILRSLYKIPYFENLVEEELAALAGMARKRSFNKGELIFTTDQKCRNLHILHSGAIKIFIVSAEGREQIIHFLKPMVFFGEEILFGDNKYEANAQALCETVLFDIGKKKMENFLLSHPQVGIAMLAYFGKKMRRLIKMVGDMALKDVQGRLVCRLVQMAHEEGEKIEGGVEIKGLTQEELACNIGTVRESLSRCLTRLQDAKLIKLSRKKILVHDVNRLQALSERFPSPIPTRSG
ncbi:MAG: Crp/Fnr family transcriptional regulator [Desulfobacteraceae bacterium]|nr:MAG: Crp/Fnr family transcriptional regulator [Desulfobacteraceae bacterium]